MTVLYANHVQGVVANATSGATTLTSSVFADLPEVVAPDYLWLTVDPTATTAAPEIVKVTAHTASATSVTVTRAQQSTTARAITGGSTPVAHAATASDFASVASSVWSDLAMAGSWGSKAGEQVCQIRLVGDDVELRGTAQVTGSSPGTPFTLPADRRPPAPGTYAAPQKLTSSTARWDSTIEIATDGTTAIVGGSTGTSQVEMHLNHIRFSTSS